MIVARVLIDNESALNACLMFTLEHLNVDTSLIHPTTMIIRAFDGTIWEVQGEIELAIGVGPLSFMVNFLERSWLHTTGAVASTLRQLAFIVL